MTLEPSDNDYVNLKPCKKGSDRSSSSHTEDTVLRVGRTPVTVSQKSLQGRANQDLCSGPFLIGSPTQDAPLEHP